MKTISKRLACLVSMLVTAGTLGACSGADGSGTSEALPGASARIADDNAVTTDPAVSTDAAAPLGEFACGPNLNCDGNTTFCEVYEREGILRPPPFPVPNPVLTYSCVPLPAACANVAYPTCASCIAPKFIGPLPEMPFFRTCTDVTGGSVVTIRNLLVPLEGASN